MFNRLLMIIGLIAATTVGCAPTTTETVQMGPELEAEIKAHDADVDAAERANK